MAQAGVGPAQLGRDVRVAHGEALDVDLVDDRVRVAVPGPVVVLPAERRCRRPGSAARCAAESRALGLAGSAWSWPSTSGPKVTDPLIALAYGSSSSLAGLHRRPRAGSHGPADPVPVGLPRADARHERVPHVGVVVPDRDLGFRACLVEQAQRDAVGDGRGDREVRPRDAGARRAWRPAGTACRARAALPSGATRGPGTAPAAVVCVLVIAVPPCSAVPAAHATHDVADGLDLAVAAQDHVGDQAGPPGLVERADRGAVVAVEVLAEDQVVVPGGIGLHASRSRRSRAAGHPGRW